MNKKNLVAAVVGVLVVGGASGQMYATHKLKSSYQNNFDIQDKRLNVDVTQFDMGLVSGKAQWNAEIVPDLCDKNNMSKIIEGFSCLMLIPTAHGRVIFTPNGYVKQEKNW